MTNNTFVNFRTRCRFPRIPIVALSPILTPNFTCRRDRPPVVAVHIINIAVMRAKPSVHMNMREKARVTNANIIRTTAPAPKLMIATCAICHRIGTIELNTRYSMFC